MPFVLALDQGTTSSRAIVFDGDGAAVATAQREITQHFPEPGWVEHDADEIWATQLATAREALATAGVEAADLAAIGITNQRETTVVWDRATGEPVHRAIVWQDRRTADLCERLKADGHEPAVRARTGLVLDPYFSGTKIAWILDHVDGARARAQAGELAVGTVDSWLLWKLTGGRVHATDVTNASRTLLFDIHALDWSDDQLALLDVPRAALPEVRPSSGAFGETDADVLGAAVPITGVAGDQHAALFGQRCRPGMAKNTYGTGCFLLYNTGSEPVASEHGLLTTVAWQIEGEPAQYALEGSVFVAGAAVQWLRDELQIIETSADVEALAASVPDSDGVVVVPAFVGLGAPHWDPYARGTVLGITRGTNRAHLARATLDGVAHQSADLLDAMTADAGGALAELRVDGGMTHNGLLMQTQADLVGVPVVRPAVAETTALGAAYLAGLGAGVWTEADLDAQWAASARWSPDPDADPGAARSRWRRAVDRAKDWAREEAEREEE
ncbi:glycerol kinase GlpK [Rubrivirga sp. IMCC45206]|uniref:glycerol kinase GlpK n=1 Tax=Rubrivirga sp. IMCC45206 TaxID=3391614 RepID=UPI00398FD4BC